MKNYYKKIMLLGLSVLSLLSCNAGTGTETAGTGTVTQNENLQNSKAIELFNFYLQPNIIKDSKNKIAKINSANQNQISFTPLSNMVLTKITVNYYASDRCLGTPTATTNMGNGVTTKQSIQANHTYTSTDSSNFALCEIFNGATSGGCTNLKESFVAGTIQSMQYQYSFESGESSIAQCLGADGLGVWSGGSMTAACTAGNCGYSKTHQLTWPTYLTSLLPNTISSSVNLDGIATTANAKYLYAANYNGGSGRIISQYSVGASGILAPLSTPNITGPAVSREIAINPAGYLYTTNFAALGRVSQFQINSTTGLLSVLSPSSVSSGNTPNGLAVTPDGKYLYVAVGSSNVIQRYSISAGKLTSLGNTTSGNIPNGIVITPDGKYLYSSMNNDNSIIGYSINSANGALTQVTSYGGLEDVDKLAITPNGSYLYGTDYNLGNGRYIYGFSIDQSTGALTQLSSSPFLTESGPTGIAISADNNSLYVANNKVSDVSGYTINQQNGALTQTNVVSLPGCGPDRLSILPNNNYLYVACYSTNKIYQFAMANMN